MTANNRTTLIFILVGVLVAGAAAYMFFFREDAATLSSSATAQSSAEFTFINLAARIEPIVFDTSVLSDPRFMNLVDLRTVITPEQTGKQNPFAPL